MDLTQDEHEGREYWKGHDISELPKICCIISFVLFWVGCNLLLYMIDYNDQSNTMCSTKLSIYSTPKDFTCVRYDGFGQQLKEIMVGMAIGYKTDWNYYYTPLQLAQGWAYLFKDIEAAKTIDKWLNLGAGERSIESCIYCVVNIPQKSYCSVHELFDNEFTKILRTRYFQNKNNTSKLYKYGDGIFNVAVHDRRGDVDFSKSPRVTKTAHYRKAMDDIAAIVTPGNNSNVSIHFHIFSNTEHELSLAEYSRNGKYKIYLHLNETWKDTFHAFVVADALITGKSTFSWVAAVLSNSSYIYYTPYWDHSGHVEPLDHWYLNWEYDENFKVTFDYHGGRWKWWEDSNCRIINDIRDNNKVYHNWACRHYKKSTPSKFILRKHILKLFGLESFFDHATHKLLNDP